MTPTAGTAAPGHVGSLFRSPVASLTNRIFVALVLLSTLSLGFAFFFANARASEEAEAELTRGLVEAATLVDQHRATLTETFTRMARLVADLPLLKAAVDTDDPPTVQPLAEDYRTQINADVLVVHNPAGRVLAAAGVLLRDNAGGANRVFEGEEEASIGSLAEDATFVVHPRGVLQVVSVPIVLGPEPLDVLGRLTVGFLMDDELATQFRALTGSEIAFAAGGRVLASSMPAAARAPMARLIETRDTTTIRIGADEYLALARPMAPSSAGATPVMLTLRSRAERLRFLNTLRAGLVGALILTLLLATVLSFAVATTMTRPLATVTNAMRDVAATGDLTRRVSVRSRAWDDADARLLASAFNTLTESIARFQRESAQKERLSSLGRLSTVIAHEIRNPLMIIRASLSTLRHGTAGPAEVREAVADIDEETQRLNSIVTEVLDFAKPIRFELAEANLNDICRMSAAAAWAGADTADVPGVRLDLDPDLPTVVTDAERLRTALVNILSNARYAVEQARATRTTADADTEPGVMLGTAGHGKRVTITVRDRGTGIAPEDMAHIFDPYFTTRRAGTGLGLPISKNIIEGLGGTLSLTSRLGAGTELRIDLPIAAAEAG
jgi:signal transduction histidine kinase